VQRSLCSIAKGRQSSCARLVYQEEVFRVFQRHKIRVAERRGEDCPPARDIQVPGLRHASNGMFASTH
jgi:hypothetical protein